MAEYTENLKLKKPADEENFDIADFNGNSDIIDEAMEKISEDISGIDEAVDAIRKDVSELGGSTTYLSATQPENMQNGDTWYQVMPDEDIPPPSSSKPDPAPDVNIVTEGFEGDGYIVDSPIPTGNGTKWAADSRYIENFVVGEDGIGKKLPALNATSIMRVKLDGYQGPIMMSAKVKMPGYGTLASSGGGTVAYGFGFGFRQDGGAQAGIDVVGMAGNGQTIVGSGYGAPIWTKDEWMNIVACIKPNMENLAQSTVTVYFSGKSHAATYVREKRSATINLSTIANGLGGSATAPAYAQMSITSPENGLPVQIKDVHFCVLNDFIMSIENADDIETDKDIRLNFSHPIDLSTLTYNRIIVTSEKGAVDVMSIGRNVWDSDYVTLAFDKKLEEGTYYTITLDPQVLDVAGKSIYDFAVFKTKSGAPGEIGDEANAIVNVIEQGAPTKVYPATKWDNVEDKPEIGFSRTISPTEMEELIEPDTYMVHDIGRNATINWNERYMLIVDCLGGVGGEVYYQTRYLRTGLETRHLDTSAPPPIVIGGAPAPKYNWTPWSKV